MDIPSGCPEINYSPHNNTKRNTFAKYIKFPPEVKQKIIILKKPNTKHEIIIKKFI